MTVFHAPLAMLPHGGLIRRPELTAAEHQAALAGLASVNDAEKRQADARAYGVRSHDAQNTQLQATARQILGSLGTAEDMTRTAIGRHRTGLEAEDDVTAVVSAERVVDRPWRETGMAILSTLFVVAVYMATEIAVIGKSVITSGIFGFLPDNGWDVFFACAFAGLPFVLAFRKYGHYGALKSTSERDAFTRKVNSRANYIGLPAWTVAMVLLLGPNLVAGDAGIAISFDEAAQAGWRTAFSDWFTDLQMVLHAAQVVLPIILFWGIMVGASNLTCGIWISHRDAANRARREDVRQSDTHAFRGPEADALLADQIQTDGAIGRLKGLIDEIAHDREAFADQVAHHVETIRQQGEMAHRSAIFAATTGRGEVIDAGPLFARH